ncbi:TPA: extracellular adherence protein Eap/Map [Staphylococcus aureus]|uniref:extracellular adherence protein Eap/Map n=1 Tax=Staphylococcus aureus TaxID=1280 RepID=UPI000E3B6D82|nr:extracellular adherence protein Eap/Map [Staphylococcus aureus]MBU6096813.1 extracellular adherence protein Eap/Map [Staphylococcus aureus]GBV00804.1 major histocompatibility complex class II analog protein, Map [Staphylococcus aureus]GBX63565.1 major histocompatibility complex class II analog protein, Map [Staphylococcus aureus]HCY1429611.1 extracellular adherence protein Eap/Map [Staphylococcus aureus]HDH5401281.1 extracellular adherence protein Eap/Map [Staphylococcus aureus]
MKFKSLITTTLALGVLASTGANFNNNEASAAAKPLDKSSSSLHHGYSKVHVPYAITVNGTSQNILSSLTFNKNQNISYKDLEDRVKSVLKSDRGISDIDLRLSKQAKYTVYFKNGTKKVIDLKAGIYTADLINTSEIKAININVDTKKQVEDKKKDKANYQVPYTITVNGTSQNILSNLTFNKNQNISYKDLEDKVKSVLESNRGITDVDLRLSKQAKYTVNFKNGTKKVIDLKSGIYTANLINSSDIKSININVDTKKHIENKAKRNYQVPYSINLNGTSTNILSNLSFSNKPWTNYKNLTSQIKSVLKHDRGISEQDLKYAKKAYYTVYFKNGGKRILQLNSKNYTANLVHAKDVKRIEITVKTGTKAKADRYVPYTIAVNGTSTPILSKLKISNKQLISYKYLNDKVKSVLKSERGISDLDLKFAKQAKYTVYFKNGKKQVVNLKSDIFTPNLFSAKDIKKIDIDVKQYTKSKKINKSNNVKFPVTINKFENIVSNEFVFYNASKITINDLSIKLKSAMANDQGITKHDIGLAERAVYKVYFKNGSSKYVDLKTEYKDERVFKATDIKKVDIELKF